MTTGQRAVESPTPPTSEPCICGHPAVLHWGGKEMLARCNARTRQVPFDQYCLCERFVPMEPSV